MNANDIRKEIRKYFQGYISVTSYNTKDGYYFNISQSNVNNITFLKPLLEKDGFEVILSPSSNMSFLVKDPDKGLKESINEEWDEAVAEAEKIFGKKLSFFTDEELEYTNNIYNNLINFQEKVMITKKIKGLTQRFLETEMSAAKFLDLEYRKLREDMVSGDLQTTSDTPELTKPLVKDEDEDKPETIDISNPDQVLKEEEIETLSDDNGENLSPSDKEDILNGDEPEGFPDIEFKEDIGITSYEDLETLSDEMNNDENLSPSDKEEILNGNEPIGFEDTEFKEDMDDLVPVESVEEIEYFPVESQIEDESIEDEFSDDICEECGLEKEYCVCDSEYEDKEVLEEYGVIDDEVELEECNKMQESVYPVEIVNPDAEINSVNTKINSIPVKGSWEEIKDFISINYNNYTNIRFINPNTGKESAIDLTKVGLNWLVNCDANDIEKVSS